LVRMLLGQQLELDPMVKGPWLALSPSPWVAAPVETEIGALGDFLSATPAAAPIASWAPQWLFWQVLV